MGQLVPVQTRIHSGITSHVQSFPFCLNKKASREEGVIPSSLLVDYLYFPKSSEQYADYVRIVIVDGGFHWNAGGMKTTTGILGNDICSFELFTDTTPEYLKHLGSRFVSDYFYQRNIGTDLYLLSSNKLDFKQREGGIRHQEKLPDQDNQIGMYRVGSRSA